MSAKNKFCPNCGEQVAIEEKFCPSCGFNFETREVPESGKQEKTSNEQEKFDFKNTDFKKLNKKQLGIIGGAIVALLLLIFLFTGKVSIAGTYESEGTLSDPNMEALFDISRNGKTDIIITDHYEGSTTKLTVYLEESGKNVYLADTSKGLDIELSTSAASNDYQSLIDDLPMEIGTLGLDVENTTDGILVSGNLTEIQAIDGGFDLRDIYIVKHGDNLMFEGDLLIKR